MVIRTNYAQESCINAQGCTMHKADELFILGYLYSFRVYQSLAKCDLKILLLIRQPALLDLKFINASSAKLAGKEQKKQLLGVQNS